MSYSNSCIPVGLCHTNVGISLDFGCLGFAKRIKVVDIIHNVFNCETENFNAHPAHIWRSYFSH